LPETIDLSKLSLPETPFIAYTVIETDLVIDTIWQILVRRDWLKPKKIPMRMCVGCREMKPKRELIRVVRAPEVTETQGDAKPEEKNQQGQITLDPVGKKPGRGAYVCPDVVCLKKAQKNRGLERAFESRVDDAIYIELSVAMEALVQKELDNTPLKPAPPRIEPERTRLTPTHPRPNG